MAKAKATAPKPERSSNATVTIDLQALLTPASIVLSSIIIAASIFFTFRDVNLLPSRNGTGTTVTVTPTVAAGDTGNTAATTNIDDDPVLGNKDTAKVAIVEFSDFECPFCQRFHQTTYPQIVSEYINTGKAIFVYRDFPLSFHEPAATKAALAAQCAFDQGGAEKYYQYAEQYFNKTLTNGQGLPSGTTLEGLASGIGLDAGRFTNCVNSEQFKDEIAKDTSDGSASGVTGTPGFIVGVLNSDGTVDGVSIPGAQDFSVFKGIIDTQLAR
jgi:protein-disulfide isomerase